MILVGVRRQMIIHNVSAVTYFKKVHQLPSHQSDSHQNQVVLFLAKFVVKFALS